MRGRKAVSRQWDRVQGRQKGRGSPISVAEVHILKLNLAPLEAKGPCSSKVLHLGVSAMRGAVTGLVSSRHQKYHAALTPLSPTPLSSLTSVSSFSRSNMFSMSIKLVWIILQAGNGWSSSEELGK